MLAMALELAGLRRVLRHRLCMMHKEQPLTVALFSSCHRSVPKDQHLLVLRAEVALQIDWQYVSDA